MPLIDSFQRTIDYLRVSVTDRCNFRCVYCMPEEGANIAPKEEILTFEEIERLVRIALELGMTKIRLTGGEPLVRRDIAHLVERIGKLPGLVDFSMTTNGFLLARYADEFARNGLHRVNISLDTLRPERFVSLARRGNLESVLEGIEASLRAGMSPIKLNCVVMRGWNDDEAADFARLTLEQPFDVRFIELMPINWSKGDDSVTEVPSPMLPLMRKPSGDNTISLFSHAEMASFRDTIHVNRPAEPSGQLSGSQMRRAFVSTDETRERIEQALGPLTPAEIITNGPARSFRLPGAIGTVGFISQITNDMCVNCNRLRLTAEGQLRPCLMADGEADLRTLLRTGGTDEQIAEVFQNTVFHKPKEHRLEDGEAPTSRSMSQIGG